MKNYTTKPIELPLSTEKEYVLVDVEGYKKAYSLNEFIMNECNLTEPFKFDVVDVDGLKGFIDKIKNTSVVSDRYKEHIHFHEVIRQPESEVEWNGEGLPPVGTVCEWCGSLGGYFVECVVIANNGSEIVVKNIGDYRCGKFEIREPYNTKFRKPETEAERKERERLEAAYDLYRKCSGDKVMYVFDDFVGLGLSEMWLTIVDKTNYRKEQN